MDGSLGAETIVAAKADRKRASALAAVVASVETVLPSHRYVQADLARLAQRLLPTQALKEGTLQRLFQRVGVAERYVALPAERYSELSGFGARNDAWLEVATRLSEEVVSKALVAAGVSADQIGLMASTTVTGVAVPSLDARLMNRLPFSPSMKRMPLFGLGCLGGAAGLARAADYLRAFPEELAVFLSVELCSLTFQPENGSLANLISTGLFGDGAAAVVLAGANHPLAATSAVPRIIASRSAFFPRTERVMGWDIIDSGFQIVLSSDVPTICAEQAGPAVDGFLASQGLSRGDVRSWIMHPGGPKVIDALEAALCLGPEALRPTRESLANVGNLSSASVLFLLAEHRRKLRPEPGEHSILMAMGPAFCAELVLLQW
ncbi:MAG: type III polyketide synthase [Myxococcales bacterium]|nr:type III polyketide synthase [Myxococcales bacterium]